MGQITIEQAIQIALEHHQAGRLAEAEAIYRQVLAEFPDHAGALHLLGVLAGQVGHTHRAIDLIARAVALDPAVAQYHSNLGEFYCRTGQWASAIASLGRAVALRPDLAVAQGNLGNAFKSTGRPGEAIAAYRRALELKGDQAAVQCNLGVVLHETGRLDEAVDAYRRALELEPGLAEAFYNLGSTLRLLGRLDEALEAFGRAVELKPDHALAHNNRGGVLHEAGRLDEAIAFYRRAIALWPDYAEAHANLGRALNDAGRLGEAIVALGRAIALRPDDALTHYQLGNALRLNGRLDEAITSYRRAIALRPEDARAHNNLGVALQEAGWLDEAIAAYNQAIALEPGLAEVYYNLGSTRKLLGQPDLAIAAFRRAIALHPEQAAAYNNMAGALHDVGRLDEARECFRKAALLNPESTAVASSLLCTLHYQPDIDAQALLAEHLHWARQFAAPLAAQIAPHPNDRTPGRRLRIGFVCQDFKGETVGRLLLPLFARRDSRHAEFLAYSDVRKGDAVTERLKADADGWINIVDLSDSQVADRVRADGIDILVDLSLHTAGNRMLVFARKPAPVQVTMLGLPSTTGLDTIDYRLTDPYLDPPGQGDDAYSERSIRLPHCFWCYEPHEAAPAVGPLPAEQNGFVTLGWLNQLAKVSRPALDLWVQVLGSIPDSRLLLQAPEGSHCEAIRAQFRDGGIAPERITFVPKVPYLEYLHRFGTLDLGLDPFPYNGHTGTLDSLWMGVPVVTLSGRTAVGRGGVSLLTNLGLPELIAHSPEEYVAIASRWASDRRRLAALRAELRPLMRASPVMDGKQYAIDVEAALREMWRTWCRR